MRILRELFNKGERGVQFAEVLLLHPLARRPGRRYIPASGDRRLGFVVIHSNGCTSYERKTENFRTRITRQTWVGGWTGGRTESGELRAVELAEGSERDAGRGRRRGRDY